MGTSKINKSELFKMAWMFAKDGSETSFRDSLKIAWNLAKGNVTGITKVSDVSEIKEVVWNMPESNDFLFILNEVKNNSNGFQKDIATKALNGKNL